MWGWEESPPGPFKGPEGRFISDGEDGEPHGVDAARSARNSELSGHLEALALESLRSHFGKVKGS